MKTYKLKQEVISRATRNNAQLTLPRHIQLFDRQEAGMMMVWGEREPFANHVIKKFNIPKDDWESTWQLFINELYEEVTDNG